MAHIIRPGVAEMTLTEGTSNLTLAGREYGAVAAFFDAAVMGADGDTCDYVIQYGDIREEGFGTRVAGPLLQRTTVYWARHANGDINQTKVTLPPGEKLVFMTVASNRVARFVDAIRAQTLTQAERDQACENLGLPQSGDKVITPQATAWVGWTKDNSLHDAAIRIVTDTNGGGLGGSVVFSTLFGRTATDDVTLTQARLPGITLATSIGAGQGSHQHGLGFGGGSLNYDGAPAVPSTTGPTNVGSNTSAATLPAMSGTTPLGGSATPFSAPIDMRVKYRNAIVCTKD